MILMKMQKLQDTNVVQNAHDNTSTNTQFSNYNDSYKSNLSFLNNLNENQKFNSLNSQNSLNSPNSLNNVTNLNSNNSLFNNNQLLSKLEYIIHLLEEQHNEKTNTITEELILYLFLGIFIIFVLDSFARASKYVR